MRIKMPAVRIAQADADSAEGDTVQDLLTCGTCQKAFALSDIVRFIQHKVLACNKENYSQCFPRGPATDRDSDEGGRPLGVANARRPSISAPMGARKGRVHTPPPASPAPHHLLEDGAASSTPKRIHEDGESNTPKRRASSSPIASSSLEEDIKPSIIKQELPMDTSSSPDDGQKKSRTEMADAESNTMHSEPSNYVCSTCKARMHSAWRLLQHVQHSHGVKIYVESPGGSGNAISGGSHKSDRSSGSSCSTSSSCSSGGVPPPSRSLRHHPLLPPPPPDLHSPFGVGSLLRMPLGANLAPLSHPTGPPTPLFPRPSHHDHRFRMEQLVSEQFRHHGLNLAAAAAAVAAGGLPPHASFPPPPSDRPPASAVPSVDRNIPQPVRNLSLEPQLDFYSQRLRQLAGTTSPGAAAGTTSSPSPRKHSPPFASPSPSRQTSVPPINLDVNSNDAIRPKTPATPEKHSRPNSAVSSINEAPTALTTTPKASTTPPPENVTSRPPSSTSDAGHTCDQCGKKFRFQSNLIVHKRTHTSEKSHKCSLCDHTCTTSSKLKRHIKNHHPADDEVSGDAGSGENADEEDTDEEIDEEEPEEEEEEDEDEYQEDEAEDLSVPSTGQPKQIKPLGMGLQPHPPVSAASLVGELMDKFGLSNIAQYSEAYRQALQESGNALKWQLANKDRDNNNGLGAVAPGSQEKINGLPPNAAIRLKEEFAKNMLGQPVPGGPPHPLFNPFENPFDAGKRMKLDMERGGEGWWLPDIHGRRPPDNVFDNLKPGADSLLQNPLLKNKDSRRNDTCEFCGKVFKNCSNLTVHRRSHTGEKPYKCELCSYACAQSSKLTRHMKTHGRLGKDVYRCRFCEMPFSVPSTLEKHMRKCVVNQSKGGAPLGIISDDSNVCKEEAT